MSTHWGHAGFRGTLTAVLAVVLMGAVWRMHAAGQPMWAVGVGALGTWALYVYAVSRSLAWKYLFPGVAGMLVFVALPLAYTTQIGFTNYSSSNLLTEERARAYLLDQTEADEAQRLPFGLVRQGRGVVIVLGPAPQEAPAKGADSAERAQGVPGPGALAGQRFVSPVLMLEPGQVPAESLALPVPLSVLPAGDGLAGADPRLAHRLSLREVVALRSALQPLKLALPADAGGAVLSYAGLREFGVVRPLWTADAQGALVQVASGEHYRPNRETGFFETAAGERMSPGFRVTIGLANYTRMLFDAEFRGPFLSIFVWTVVFAGLTVLFSSALGMALAVALNWEALRFRTLYRTLLFLPYAVPGFISILVFKGLFNQNFGEINAILDALFGIRPAWFADPLLAKAMLLIVNTWLGYPYFLVLCTGLIKAIPADLYEASALAGASPWANFRRITAPLIIKPLTPLLISAFAFNFNNFVLIALLTDGRPDFLNTKLPAGTTDILVSYTYRIAFTDAGQNFGLAAAISTLIFVMVAVMAWVQLRVTRQAEGR